MLYRFAFFISFIFLVACFNNKVMPDHLPEACLGQYYTQKIEILNGYVVDSTFSYNTSDKNFKLLPRLYNNGEHDVDINNNLLIHEDYNNLSLSGMPNSLNPIEININYDIYKNMFSFFEPKDGYKKTYIIHVKQCN